MSTTLISAGLGFLCQDCRATHRVRHDRAGQQWRGVATSRPRRRSRIEKFAARYSRELPPSPPAASQALCVQSGFRAHPPGLPQAEQFSLLAVRIQPTDPRQDRQYRTSHIEAPPRCRQSQADGRHGFRAGGASSSSRRRKLGNSWCIPSKGGHNPHRWTGNLHDHGQLHSVGIYAATQKPSAGAVVARRGRCRSQNGLPYICQLSIPLVHALCSVPNEHPQLSQARRPLNERECFGGGHPSSMECACAKRKLSRKLRQMCSMATRPSVAGRAA